VETVLQLATNFSTQVTGCGVRCTSAYIRNHNLLLTNNIYSITNRKSYDFTA